MKTIVSILLVFGLCTGIAYSQEKALARTCTEGIFTFKAPSNLTKIQGPKVQSLKNQMMQGGRELAKASGTADPHLFAESSLTFFSAYESAAGGMLVVLLGDKSPVDMNRDEMFKTNSERIRWGKNSGQLSSASRGVSKLDIDGIPVLLMDIVSPNGERLQTYTFFVPDHPKHSFAITFKTPKGQHQAMIDEIIESLKIARGKVSVPSPGRQGANQPFGQQPAAAIDDTKSAIQLGDTVVVANEDAKLMAGNTVVTLLKAGTEMKVTKVSSRWIAVVVAVNGASTVGWVSINDLKPVANKVAPKADAVAPLADAVSDTSVHDAAQTGDIAAVRALLEKQPELVNARNNDRQTPLHIAAKNGHKEMVGLLLEKGAEVSAKDKFEGTPLHWAVLYGQRDVAELLLTKGAAVNAKERKGWTPLHYAAYNGRRDLADLLLSGGADIDAKQAEGMMPLHVAARNGKKDVADLLVLKGAKIDAKDNNSHTPVEYALTRGHKDLIATLNPQDSTSLPTSSLGPIETAGRYRWNTKYHATRGMYEKVRTVKEVIKGDGGRELKVSSLEHRLSLDGKMEPVLDPRGAQHTQIEIDSKAKVTHYAGLSFAVPCVVDIADDGTIVVNKEGVICKDEQGKSWVSRKVGQSDGNLIAYFVPATSKPVATHEIATSEERERSAVNEALIRAGKAKARAIGKNPICFASNERGVFITASSGSIVNNQFVFVDQDMLINVGRSVIPVSQVPGLSLAPGEWAIKVDGKFVKQPGRVNSDDPTVAEPTPRIDGKPDKVSTPFAASVHRDTRRTEAMKLFDEARSSTTEDKRLSLLRRTIALSQEAVADDYDTADMLASVATALVEKVHDPGLRKDVENNQKDVMDKVFRAVLTKNTAATAGVTPDPESIAPKIPYPALLPGKPICDANSKIAIGGGWKTQTPEATVGRYDRLLILDKASKTADEWKYAIRPKGKFRLDVYILGGSVRWDGTDILLGQQSYEVLDRNFKVVFSYPDAEDVGKQREKTDLFDQ